MSIPFSQISRVTSPLAALSESEVCLSADIICNDQETDRAIIAITTLCSCQHCNQVSRLVYSGLQDDSNLFSLTLSSSSLRSIIGEDELSFPLMLFARLLTSWMTYIVLTEESHTANKRKKICQNQNYSDTMTLWNLKTVKTLKWISLQEWLQYSDQINVINPWSWLVLHNVPKTLFNCQRKMTSRLLQFSTN